ncbi:MAG TPA: serine/threonine-protein kinase, partial [Anaerolineaceae bacterium]|nr:serine/threonine-protein kinase [Anaerolineaceae bacterium]
MTDAFIEDFLAGFDDSRFPGEFLQNYEIMECLAHNELGETLLVKDLRTGAQCVAKCYPEQTILPRTTESELLKKLHHAGLPVYVGEYRNDQMLCVVRSFTPGMPLDQLAQEQPLSRQQALDIAVQLCDILTVLHGQTHPIIHRDLKPQNIIVDEHGKVTLIDFGTSRVYDETAREDTLSMGTRHYAAPEQYGFSQTDCRSDIYSLGVVLCWMLTGSVEVEQAVKAIPDRRLAKIVAKCAAFAPKDRYKSAAQVKDALTGRARRRGAWAALAAALVVIAAALHLANLAPWQRQAPAPAQVTFQEHLIERAVRLTLGKTQNEPITEQDLESITELYVFGNKAASDQATFTAYGQHFIDNDGTVFRGDIDT